MRKAGFALALAATTQLTLLSSPAFAQGSGGGASAGASVSLGGGDASASASASGAATPAGAAPKGDSKDDNSGKKTTGWVLVGAGSAAGIAGIVIDIVAANSGHVSGAGGPGDNGNTDNTRTDLFFLGTSLIVAGTIAGIYGGSLVWSADHETKAVSPQDDDQRRDEDAKNSPTKAVKAQIASAPSVVIPLLRGTF